MNVIWQSKRYAPELVATRYVRALGGNQKKYAMREVGADRCYDIRQSVLNSDELPQSIRDQADKFRQQMCGSAEWPIE